MRDEIVQAINELTKPLEPSPDPGPGPWTHVFWQIYLLLIEDASLGSDPRRGIGYFLKDEREASAFATLREPLERVVAEVGADKPDAEYEAAQSVAELDAGG